jgi:predicted transcriptional regulator of viral defense system
LSYNSTKNRITKLKKSLYSIKDEYTNHYLIANKAYQPSYISFETALSYHNLIPEIVYSITSATAKSSRNWEIGNIDYDYRTIKQTAYTGYIVGNMDGTKFYIATPEKALADYLYFLYLGKSVWNDRLDIRTINKKKLKEYLLLFSKNKLLNFSKKYIPNL